MKRKNWISTLLTIGVLAAAFYIYKYSYLVSQYRDYYVYYEDVHGLQKSSPIYIDGVQVGRVSDIEFSGKEHVKVTLTIKKDVNLNDSTVAQLAANGLVGDKMIVLYKSNSNTLLKHKDTLIPEMDTTVIFMSQQVEPIIASAQYQIRSADSNIQYFNRRIKQGLLSEISASLSSLNKDMKGFVSNIHQFNNEMDTTILSIRNAAANTSSMVDNIAHTNESIKGALELTNKYAKPTISSDLASIKSSFSSIAKAVNGITNKDTGALGPLLHTKKTYISVTQKADTAKQAIEDVKDNPPVISIIGG